MQAEEITLTIGQAFDLAYRRFLETTGREMEGRRQVSQLQENVQSLERKNEIFRRRLIDLSALIETNRLSEYLASQGVSVAILDKHPLALDYCRATNGVQYVYATAN